MKLLSALAYTALFSISCPLTAEAAWTPAPNLCFSTENSPHKVGISIERTETQCLRCSEGVGPVVRTTLKLFREVPMTSFPGQTTTVAAKYVLSGNLSYRNGTDETYRLAESIRPENPDDEREWLPAEIKFRVRPHQGVFQILLESGSGWTPVACL